MHDEILPILDEIRRHIIPWLFPIIPDDAHKYLREGASHTVHSLGIETALVIPVKFGFLPVVFLSLRQSQIPHKYLRDAEFTAGVHFRQLNQLN
jgi:hypothetical protein